tara:strand:- start:958 stop:1329 length:372 start_codon:yes stop_codon:yes gene_type:complete
MGYNGVERGSQHCVDYFKEVCGNRDYQTYLQSQEFLDEHHAWADKNEFHGEQNAILYAAKTGVPTDATTMYTLYSPCLFCAKVIVTAGIVRVVYHTQYDRSTDGIDFLRKHNIECCKFEDSGE